MTMYRSSRSAPGWVAMLALALCAEAVAQGRVAVGADADPEFGPMVQVVDMRDLEVVHDFPAYAPGFQGGVRVAVGDINGDGVPDIIVGAGPGHSPLVRLVNGRSGALLGEFMAFDPSFSGGVYVAVGDINGDGIPDIIVGTGPGGGGRVNVFSGRDQSFLGGFLAYGENHEGEVRVAAGDIDGDGRAEVIVAPGPGRSPEVRVFGGQPIELLTAFVAYDAPFMGGLFIAVGDVSGDGMIDIVTGADADELEGPHVKCFGGVDLGAFCGFRAYAAGFQGGVRVAVGDINGDGIADIITAPGPTAPPQVKAFLGGTLVEGQGFFAFDAEFDGGLFVAAPPRGTVILRDGFEAE
ncbi:MAG TPA: VCBS repeat-containing protein [Xanthomonadaceae bacterium]|nr:VCBS repeat-containing protein [Xanthomonadaceae bacterium]